MYAPNPTGSWDFHFGDGDQDATSNVNPHYVWAVRYGARSVPGLVAVYAGSYVTVSPDPDVSLTFDNVTAGGDAIVTEISNPAPDANFRIVSGKSYDITFTGTFSGLVTVCLNYNDSDVSGNENNLKIMHRGDSGGWTDITTSRDTVNNIVCGVTASFSEFAVTEPVDATPPTPRFIYEKSDLTLNVDGSRLRALMASANTHGAGVTGTQTPSHPRQRPLTHMQRQAHTP